MTWDDEDALSSSSSTWQYSQIPAISKPQFEVFGSPCCGDKEILDELGHRYIRDENGELVSCPCGKPYGIFNEGVTMHGFASGTKPDTLLLINHPLAI